MDCFDVVIFMMYKRIFLLVRTYFDIHTFANRISDETLADDTPCLDVLKPAKTYGDINCFPVAFRSDSGSWLPLTELRDHTQTYHSR
jgi:hypothetical protein